MHTLFEKKFLILSLICNGKGCFLSLFVKIPFTCSHRESTNYRVFLKSFFTYSHWARQFTKPSFKKRHKKDAYLSISVKWLIKFQKMITQMNFCFDFLLLYLHNRGIIQTKTLNTMCYRLLEVGHWNIKIL